MGRNSLIAYPFPSLAWRLQKRVRSNQEHLGMERAKTHPILIVAGIAVLLFSLLGAAALTGVVPADPGPASPSSASTQAARS
jgi:hypothetical protein